MLFSALTILLPLSSARQLLLEELGRRQQPAYQTCKAETRTGYIKNTAGQYLTCTNENCHWESFEQTETSLFHQENSEPPRPNGRERRRTESIFEIYTPAGGSTGQCLNVYQKSWGSPPTLRMADCKLRGSRRWNLCGGYLVTERHNCVQSNAQVARCDQSHEVVTMEAPKCIITSTTIDNLKCLSPITGGGCAATGFDAGSMAGASSQSDCDACYAAKGSSQQCSFTFAYTTQNTITNSWTHSHTWQLGVSFQLSENFVFGGGASGSATEGLTFSFSSTLTSGKSTTKTTTMQDSTGCDVTLPAGVRESATANYLVGTIHADFNATVTRHYTCNTGAKKQKSYVDTMTLTITNVPTQRIVGSCTTRARSCNNTLASRLESLL